jgi:hypothetical protein
MARSTGGWLNKKTPLKARRFLHQGPVELLRNRLLEHAIDLLVGRIA